MNHEEQGRFQEGFREMAHEAKEVGIAFAFATIMFTAFFVLRALITGILK